MAHHAAERRNFVALLVQGVARRIGNELSSEKLVLPFLYTAFSGPVFFAGFFAPVVILGRLAAQLLGARLVALARRTSGYIAASTAVAAFVLLVIAFAGHAVPVFVLPILFISAAAIWGICSGFGAMTFQDLIGRVLSERPRINLLFAIGAVSGAGVVVFTIVSQLVTGFTPEQDPADDHLHLVVSGAILLLLSSVAALAIREEPRAVPAEGAGREDEAYLPALAEGVRRVFRLPWFRRFVVARMLLMSVEMPLPFFAVYGARFHARTVPSLTVLVIAVSLGMIAGGLVWPRVSKRSIQLVLSLSAAVAGLAALLALASHVFDDVRSLFTHAVMIFLLGFGTQGALDGSTAYVVGSATDEERAYCIAVASLAAGLAGLLIAFLAGLIAHERGAIAALGVMGLVTVVTAIQVRTLPVVHPSPALP